jgi:hypothetical protein
MNLQSELHDRADFLLREKQQRERMLRDRGIKDFSSDPSWCETRKQLDKAEAELRKLLK